MIFWALSGILCYEFYMFITLFKVLKSLWGVYYYSPIFHMRTDATWRLQGGRARVSSSTIWPKVHALNLEYAAPPKNDTWTLKLVKNKII